MNTTHTLATIAVRVGLILQDHESWNADTIDAISNTFHAANLTGQQDGLFQLHLPCSTCEAPCHLPEGENTWAHIDPPTDAHRVVIDLATPHDPE